MSKTPRSEKRVRVQVYCLQGVIESRAMVSWCGVRLEFSGTLQVLRRQMVDA